MKTDTEKFTGKTRWVLVGRGWFRKPELVLEIEVQETGVTTDWYPHPCDREYDVTYWREVRVSDLENLKTELKSKEE
jgi:hypothetical protein